MSARPRVFRWRIVLGVSAAVSLSAAFFMVVPALFGLTPRPIRDHPFEVSAAAFVLAYVALRTGFQSRSWQEPHAARARRLFDRLDTAADGALEGGLSVLLGLLAAGFLLSWAPHYVTWPWCRDEDAFATLAQSWFAGIRPYRDIRAYNFPGHIYLHAALGWALGWGRTRVFYALDAAALAGLGLALPVWSRRRLGGTLPGLAAYVVFLGFYLILDYEQVAERDWHAALAAALGLMALEAWPGRRGLWMAAACEAVALTIRPHAVLFVPAMAWAMRQRPHPARALAEWLAAVGLLTALGFAPLAAQGILDDLIRGLRVASYGGPYSRTSADTARQVVLEALLRPWIVLQLGCLGILSLRGGDRRHAAQAWLLALAAAIVYRAVHPTQHRYLELPLALFSSVTVAFLVAALVSSSSARLSPPLRVFAIVLLLMEAVPGIPQYCSPRASLRALGPLVQGVEAAEPPPGCRIKWFKPGESPYEWPDYRAALDYLRRETRPATQIANVLKKYPFPPFNGPVGRLSPFRAESGICWMWMIDLDLDAEFARALEETPDSVVVWSPGEVEFEPRLKLRRLTEVILRCYQPAARFGPIEIWTRRPEPPGGPAKARTADRPGTDGRPGHCLFASRPG